MTRRTSHASTKPITGNRLFIVSALVISGWTLQSAQAQPETLTIVAANSVKEAFRKVLPLL